MKISVPEIRNAASVINNILRQRNTFFLNMIRDITGLVSNDTLSGPGYDSMKNFFKTAYIGVAYGFMQVNQLLMTANVSVVNRLSATGTETIDTADLTIHLSRINSLTDEMNRVVTVSVGKRGSRKIKGGPDHSGEIARINEVVRKIRHMIDEDVLAVSLYDAAIAKLEDVTASINIIKKIMYNPSTRAFDYSVSDFELFGRLFKNGEDIIMPSEFFTGLSISDENEMNDLIGKTFRDLVVLGIIPMDFAEKLGNVKSDIASQNDWKDIHNMTIDEWLKKYPSGIANTYGGWTETGNYVKYPPTGDQSTYTTPGGLLVPCFFQRAYDEPYAGSTLNYTGCGPTSAAMLISAVTGKYTTPVDVMNSVRDVGNVVAWEGYDNISDTYKTSISIEGAGTHIYGLSKVIDTYGLKSEIIGIASDTSKLAESLDNGNMAIIHVSGARESASGVDTNYLDGDGGHYITAYKGSKDGMVMILDPNNPANNVEVPYDTLSKVCRTEINGDMNVILVESGG